MTEKGRHAHIIIGPLVDANGDVSVAISSAIGIDREVVDSHSSSGLDRLGKSYSMSGIWGHGSWQPKGPKPNWRTKTREPIN